MLMTSDILGRKRGIALLVITFCRNLQSKGKFSFSPFCSTMCVRLSKDTLSLQLHTPELWTGEPRGREVRKEHSSAKVNLMMRFEDTRESFLIVVLTSLRSRSRS